MVLVGVMMGQAPKAKGNADRADRSGGEILEAGEGTKAGCRTVLGAAVVEGTRMEPGSECGVTLPLCLPGR